MKIINKQLTDKGVRLTLSDSNPVIRVLVDNANNYCNVNQRATIKHSFTCDFDQYGSTVMVYVPSDASTLIFITVYIEVDGEEEKDTVMFANDFSIFKAKTKYLDVFCDCDNNCCCDRCHDCYHHGRCKGDACMIDSYYNNCNRGGSSNWSLGTCGESHCSDYGTYCRGCEDKNKHYTMMTFMLRWNLFSQCYKKNNVRGALQYYKDLCRVQNLNKIPFDYADLDFDYSANPGKLHELYDTMNTWIKNNVNTCANKIIEKMLMADMYSLIFDKSQNDGSPEWILDDHIWNMNNEYWDNDKHWNN